MQNKKILVVIAFVLIVIVGVVSGNPLYRSFPFIKGSIVEIIIFSIALLNGIAGYFIYNRLIIPLVVWLIAGSIGALFLSAENMFFSLLFVFIAALVIAHRAAVEGMFQQEKEAYFDQNSQFLVEQLSGLRARDYTNNSSVAKAKNLNDLENRIYEVDFKVKKILITIERLESVENTNKKLIYYSSDKLYGVVLFDINKQQYYLNNFSLNSTVGLYMVLIEHFVVKIG